MNEEEKLQHESYEMIIMKQKKVQRVWSLAPKDNCQLIYLKNHRDFAFFKEI